MRVDSFVKKKDKAQNKAQKKRNINNK